VFLAMGIAVMDESITNLALPMIAPDLTTTDAQAIWIINSYRITLAVFFCRWHPSVKLLVFVTTLIDEVLSVNQSFHWSVIEVNPNSVAGFSTRIFSRTDASGAQLASKSNNKASSGFIFSVGCGQSLPHNERSGAASMYARASLLVSA
jgi:hypothetical protein